MKKIKFIFAFLLFGVKYDTVIAQDQWTWIKGDTTRKQFGIYGIKNVTDFNNKPGARYGSVSWVDKNGNFWLFGGVGYSKPPYSRGLLNDLWMFDISTKQWTWVSGYDSPDQLGLDAGIKGIAGPLYFPGSREHSNGWTDSLGNLWLFGGYGWSSNGYSADLNDLWKFDINLKEWAWMNGANNNNADGHYGIKGFSDTLNMPDGRALASSAQDAKGNFYLFCGRKNNTDLNDLWVYNINTNIWTWLSGDSLSTPYNIPRYHYGTKGVANSLNKPSPRNAATGIMDSNGDIWLFGGVGTSTSYLNGRLNDLWRYNTVTNQWTWMSGEDYKDSEGFYGTKGLPGNRNRPSSKELPASWIDNSGNLLLFGGGKNDLWKYNITTKEWTWLSGDSANPIRGIYGIQGVSTPYNKPGSRRSVANWKDSSGSLWIFGGEGLPGNDQESNSFSYLSDLWQYKGNGEILSNNLIAINAQWVLENAFLTWETPQDVNIESFDVERSIDAINFNFVSNIKAYNSSNGAKYSFTDYNISQIKRERTLYRLKIKNKEGVPKYSQIISLNFDNSQHSFRLLQNPIKDILPIEIKDRNAQKISVTIHNVSGKKCFVKNIHVLSGVTSYSLIVSRLEKGIFYLTVKMENGETKTLSFLKQ